jgi:hypothetical protein
MDGVGDSAIRRFGSRLGFSRYVKAVLWKARLQDDGRQTVHRFIKQGDLDRLVGWVDMHQQDPQLLDVYLHDNIPQLAAAYLESLSRHSYVDEDSNPEYCLLPTAVCKILYTFCKVRGEKVILGLLNNETRYLEPLLLALERASKPQSAMGHCWEERYILLLWLSLQLLAPFDLATISSIEPGDDAPQESLNLPSGLPGIAKRLVPICLRFLDSTAREQKAAAVLLARLCLRQDLRTFGGFLNSMTDWVLQSFDGIASAAMPSVHEALGELQFINYLLQFGTKDEVGEVMPRIYDQCEKIFSHESFQFIQNSAVARKLRLKLMRNIVKLVLASEYDALPTEEVVGGFISLLLDVMGDNDSLVRLAASKSLSMIAQILDPSAAEEVLSAILECLEENVLWSDGARDLSAVNPLRWHGFTLTLSHLLYRRAIPLEMLPKSLGALLLSLNFEQRSATGSKIGTNVRDAANFGLWALSRRYTTDELLDISMSEISAAAEIDGAATVIQYIALELLKSSCLDPAGNVRRGSSAGLQELVGRHPKSVIRPIDLVQNVSYMAVGLPSKAMNAGVEAALLHPIYWHSIFDGVVGWRGLESPESAVRELAAEAIGQLGLAKNIPSGVDLFHMIRILTKRLCSLADDMAEERHGIRLGLAAAILCLSFDPEYYLKFNYKDLPAYGKPGALDYDALPVPRVVFVLMEMANQPSQVIPIDQNSYRSAEGRPDLTSAATLAIIKSLTTALHRYQRFWIKLTKDEFGQLRDCFELCIRRSEVSVLAKIDSTLFCLYHCFDGHDLERRAKRWLSDASESGTANRYPGLWLALGTAASMRHPSQSFLSEDTSYEILNQLKHRCSVEVQIEARVNALEALRQMASGVLQRQELFRAAATASTRFNNADYVMQRWTTKVLTGILEGVVSGLNDYTINERGDVGCLARLSALEVVKVLTLFSREMFTDAELASKIQLVNTALRRMAVEKLDKVRSSVLDINSTKSVFSFLHPLIENEMQRDARSEAYFALNLSPIGSTQLPSSECRSLVHGYSSSAGIGSESVMRAARRGLLLAFESQAPKSVQGFERFIAQAIEILGSEGNKDNVSVPVLETIAYLGDSGLISLLHASDVK